MNSPLLDLTSFASIRSRTGQVLRVAPASTDWGDRAACTTEDPELFFPVGTRGPALAQIEQARGICQRCGVRQACLAWAIDSGADYGVWGDLSKTERYDLIRSQRRLKARSTMRAPAA